MSQTFQSNLKFTIKGTATQNICCFKWSKGLWLKKKKKGEHKNLEIFVGPLNYVSRIWEEKSALLNNFTGQTNGISMILQAKTKGSVIFRGKVCLAPKFCGTKSPLLHNIAGKDIVLKANIRQYFFFNRWKIIW